MAVTQDDFSIMKDRGYPGQAADTSAQINDTKTAEEGSTFIFGDVAVAAAEGDSFCAKFDGSQTYFEGLVCRYLRDDKKVFVDHPANDIQVTQFSNPKSVDLSIMGGWYVVPAEAITKKGQAALNAEGKFVEAKSGTFALQGVSYEETGPAGEVLKIRLTGGRLITPIA